MRLWKRLKLLKYDNLKLELEFCFLFHISILVDKRHTVVSEVAFFVGNPVPLQLLQQFYWLIDWLMDGWIDWLIDWLIDLLYSGDWSLDFTESGSGVSLLALNAQGRIF